MNWPAGLGGKGNEGVTQQVKQTEGAIGYVELIYALSNNLPYAQVKNPAGSFVTPSLNSVSAAAASAKFAKDTDFRVSITNAPGAECVSHLLVHLAADPAGQPRRAKGKAIKDFLSWMVTPEAQSMAQELKYAPLAERRSSLWCRLGSRP